MKIYNVNAFCNHKDGGNPAGVVLNADWISPQEMQTLAKVINHSETAFVLKSDCADYKVKFFTPASEVDLCGHASIATFYVLFREKFIAPGRYSQETLAGTLAIEVLDDGRVYMDQPLPVHYGAVSKFEVAETLGLGVDDIIGLPQIISTGLKDIIIHVKDSHTLSHLKADMAKIKSLTSKYKVVGYHVFTTDAQAPYKAQCRNFAPLYDIDEEAATGTSSGALTAYILGQVDTTLEDGPYQWAYAQGLEMNRPSRIDVAFTVHDKKISRLRVGGHSNIFESK